MFVRYVMRICWTQSRKPNFLYLCCEEVKNKKKMVKESKVKAQNSKVVKQANNRPKVVLGTGRYLAEIDYDSLFENKSAK